MPTPTNSQAPAGAPANLVPISNTFEKMTAAGFGPEQADVEVLSSEYVAFDYNGKLPDPIIAVRWNCRPLGGENDGKDFTIEWGCGPKAHDFAILNDGGAIAALGSKQTLTNTSNWALALKSMVDAGFMDTSLDGPTGMGFFVGGQFTLRRIPQPQRSGLSDKNEAGFAKEYYTCLKVLALPGEKKGTARPRAAAAARPAVVTPAPAVVQARAAALAPPQAQAPAQPAANGIDLLGLISQALAANGGSLEVSTQGLSTPVFKAAQASGVVVREAHKAGAQALALVQDENAFYTAIAEAGLAWQINDQGVLVG